MIWYCNSIDVSADGNLSLNDVKIEYGISVNTINRKNDLDLFIDRNKYTTIFDKKQIAKIENAYGENDFLITYNDEFYLSFRHFKLNRRHQHKYSFNFEDLDQTPILKVSIEGRDDMAFKRGMIKISEADKYICITPIESAGTIYNMVELTKE